jgi:MFS family permease
MAVSLVGSGLWLVAVAWQVIELGGGPAQLSLVTGLYSAGLVAFVLFGGIAADRTSQRRVMIGADVTRAAAVLTVGMLGVGDALEIWHLAVAGLVLGVGEAFFIPSYTALIPHLLPDEELLAANGLEASLRPIAYHAIGPVLGGGVIAVASPGMAMVADGATYLFSAACLLLVRTRPVPATAPATGPGALLTDFREGWHYMWTTPWLRTTLLFALGLVLLVMGPLEVLLPFAVRDHLGGDAGGYGIVLAAFGVGGAVGALAVSSRRLPRRYLTVMLLGWGVGSLPLAAVGVAGSLWIMATAVFVLGASFSGAMVIWGTLLQRRVPDGLRGRISSLDFFVSLALMPVSMALAGPAGDLFGVTAVFAVAGIAPAGLAILAIVLPRLDRDELLHPLDVDPRALGVGPADGVHDLHAGDAVGEGGRGRVVGHVVAEDAVAEDGEEPGVGLTVDAG